MALVVKPLFNSPKQWARDSLVKAPGVNLLKVVRVFPPLDTNDHAEVLFLDKRERPFTAFLRGDGTVARTKAGW